MATYNPSIDSLPLTGNEIVLLSPPRGPTPVSKIAALSAGGSPGGSNAQIQFNNNGAFGGLATTGTGNAVLAASPTITAPTITGGATADTLNLTAFNSSVSLAGSSIMNSSTNYNSIGLGFGAAQSIPTFDTETTAMGFRALQLYASGTGENTAYGWNVFSKATGAAYAIPATSTTTAGTTLNFANTTVVIGLTYITGVGIPDNTTIASRTLQTVVASQNVTVASGAYVSFGSQMYPTTSATTNSNVLNFASTTGITTSSVAYSNPGGSGAIATYANVTALTGTTVTLDANVTVASGDNVYFAGASGNFNTGVGVNVGGTQMIYDSGNTLMGTDAFRNSQGSFNAAFGNGSLKDGNHTYDAAFGNNALACQNLTSAVTYQNVAVGRFAMGGSGISLVHDNVAAGFSALLAATTAANNVAVGASAAIAGTAMAGCVAIGATALLASTSGSNMVAIGLNSLKAILTGSNNIAIGRGSMSTVTGNVLYHIAIGDQAMSAWNAPGTANTVVLANTVIGASTTMGSGSTATAVTAVGAGSVAIVTSGARMAIYGNSAGNKITTGGTTTIIGDSVGSTTLATGLGNILIGVDANTDTAAAGTNDNLIIKGRSGTAVPSIFGNAINTALPSVAIGAGGSATTPTAGTDILAGMFKMWKNSGDASVKLYYNDAGTLKSVALV